MTDTNADIEKARQYCVNQLRSAQLRAFFPLLIPSFPICHAQGENVYDTELTGSTGRATTTPISFVNLSPGPPEMPTMPCARSISSSPASPRPFRTPR